MARSVPVAEQPATAGVDQLAERYQLHELLGQGGMASVYRATDRMLRRDVALKQLTVDVGAPQYAHLAALFEREFHILAQLAHPHVVEVFEYGLRSDVSAFYTMDLLDGGDLRELAGLPWREACGLMHGVCSALALLHSRRLLHRDVTPRNVRRTRAGVAKLIDFGAMCPMTAGSSEVVGTPAFTAPESLQRRALDARTDLFSLGVTLYYALTRNFPYEARTFTDLASAWSHKPLPPSAFVPDIPAALDDLVMSLVSVEPGLRPANACEVMERLAACAGLQGEESNAVSQAYLSTPTLVGRDDALSQLRAALRAARGHGPSGVVVQAASGCGRSRLLDACALDASTLGFSVARATATGAREPYAVAQRLVTHLLDTVPRAAEPAEPANDQHAHAGPAAAQQLLWRVITNVSRAYPLLIAVDDVHKIDEPSAALLAELLDSKVQKRVVVVLTSDCDVHDNAALHALARRCSVLPLAPLTHEETHKLLGSLFGEVANLDMLSHEIHAVASGNPRQTLELAQHLLDHGVVRYTSGSWTLPGRLQADDLPRSAAAAMHARIMRFSPQARFLGQAIALAFDEEFSDRDFRALLPSASSRDVELAVFELLEAAAVLRDGAIYRLANRVWSATFLADLDPEGTKLRHRALAGIYAGRNNAGFVHHAFAAGQDEEALAVLEQSSDAPVTSFETQLVRDAGRLAWCYPVAIQTARRLGHSRRAEHDLRRWQYLGSIASPWPADRDSARLWLEQITHDVGLDLYRADTSGGTPQERLFGSLQRAQERYLATPEHERVYPVDQAFRKLGEYVLYAVVDGARSLDSDLLHLLPDLVQPYAVLSPLLEAIWLNLLGAREAHCNANYARARELWREMFQKVEALDEAQRSLAQRMVNAVLFALGTVEAVLGLASAAEQAERLETDEQQKISALGLRKIVQLERGDAEGAERFRREAEVLSLQQRMPQMFNSFLAFEAFVYSRCNHLAGLTQTIEQLKPMAARYPGWLPVLLHAEGSFQLVRGDYQAARVKLEEGIRAGTPHVYFPTWVSLHAALAECLLSLGHTEDARDIAGRALKECEARGSAELALELIHVLALAEATLGDARGVQRLDALIAGQSALGVTGLRLGLSYETRARVAICSGDAPSFEHFARLTASEYRHHAGTSLAVRYERLMNEAARAGLQAKLTLTAFKALAGTNERALSTDPLLAAVRSMAAVQSVSERATIALQMICMAHGAEVGYLFLLTPAGLELRAAQGKPTPAANLMDQVSAFVTNQQKQAADLDDMTTGLVDDADELQTLPNMEAPDRRLLPLRCIVDSVSVLVGVALIEPPPELRVEPHIELLTLVATSLLEGIGTKL